MNKKYRYLICFTTAGRDGTLSKRTEVHNGAYREQVVRKIRDAYNIDYVYTKDDDIGIDLDMPHIKYCRELNTDIDDYKKSSSFNLPIDTELDVIPLKDLLTDNEELKDVDIIDKMLVSNLEETSGED